MNVMKKIAIEKVTLNFGSGKDQGKLEKGMYLIKHVTGKDPVKTITNKRIPSWGLRPGLPVGCKLTIRKEAKELISRMLKALKNTVPEKAFDNNGTISLGIPEYIDIEGVEYDPKIGIMGFEIAITLNRPGFRIKKRRLKPAKVPVQHRISKEDAMEFMKKEFNIEVEQ